MAEHKEKKGIQQPQKFQQLRAFPEFTGGAVDTKGEYKKPTEERIEQIEGRLDALGTMMDGATFPYWLDGAINISLLLGEYIRDHKDVDVSVLEEDLQEVEQQLQEKGYAIVASAREKAEEGQRCVELVSAKEIKERKLQELQIVRINDEGLVIDSYEGLNFVDLHVHSRDEAGDIIFGYTGATFPKAYLQISQTKTTRSGHEIPVTQAVVVAYHKIQSGRDYDFRDISHIKQLLSDDDVEFLITTVRQESDSKIESYRGFLENIFSRLHPSMEEGDIREVLLEHTAFRNLQKRDPQGEVFIQQFPTEFVRRGGMEVEECIEYLLETVQVREKLQRDAEKKIQLLETALQ